ncbi:hypothetical protein P168DRAFT_292206 [Aspergillus campestris IBT 28561]|uniref:Uncharacterized protein n=1 Tax=Aspergillus campestris (strain IBT 28561) TaxID=1392248 RepID=A0A2I1CWV1_ASPC2|nr:uncharacterized protein P168DRAFT_292206 [Aspergillus campestris IBT 28561]PKY02101.1 hypothetical protein P168DRAFT_292206 [Aspergillus campestris IBT 28561]
MSDLLADSTYSPPRGEPDPYLVSSSPGDREGLHDAAVKGQFEEFRPAANNKTWIISERYCRIGDSVDSFEPILHNLWYLYYQGGRYMSHESTEHDRLVLDVVRTRGLGPLTRPAPSGCGIDIARTPAGPSTRVDGDRLCQIALVLFRDALETEREFGTAKALADADPRRTMLDLSIAALLPAVCTWLNEAGRNLLLLSDASWNSCPATIAQCGETFIESELGRRAPAGFSPWRWMYWLKRLHEIGRLADEASESGLKECAQDAIETMLGHVEERNSKILRVFEGVDDKLKQDPDLVGLKNLMKEDEGDASE